MMTILLVIIGGGVGAIARFLVDGLIEAIATARGASPITRSGR